MEDRRRWGEKLLEYPHNTSVDGRGPFDNVLEKINGFTARSVPDLSTTIKSNIPFEASEPSVIRPGTVFEYIFGSSSGG